jgi:hypothetical protein
MSKMNFENFKKELKIGLKYPWNNSSRLWYILWILVPIFGWAALIGYYKTIVNNLISNNRKELPPFGDVMTNFKEGVMIFIFFIPTFVVLGLVSIIPFVGQAINVFASIFLVPWLSINFFTKGTFDSLWELKKAFNIVTNNIKEYIYVWLKTAVFSIIYAVLSLVLVGIPCGTFGKMYFFTEFYTKYKK